MIDHPTDKTLQQITSKVATEIIMEGHTEFNEDHQLEKEILVEEILGQGQDHQREKMIDALNANNLHIMQIIA